MRRKLVVFQSPSLALFPLAVRGDIIARFCDLARLHFFISCRGGFVEVSDQDRRQIGGPGGGEGEEEEGDVRWRRREHGSEWSSRKGHNALRICGQDQRLHPPIVLFSDSGIATILYK